MKKKLLILAVAGLALASCSNDEVVQTLETSDANAISFRPLMNNVTRAADQTASTLQATGKGFYVTAIHTSTDATPVVSTYFDNVQFKYDGGSGTYNSDKKYYWPASGTIDFFAYAPATDGSQLVRANSDPSTDYKIFTVAPSTTVAEQVDFIYANTDGKSKTGAYTPTGGSASTYGAAGVPLNFRHAESKIIVKVKNSTVNDMQFEITQMKIVNVDNSATFTYNDDSSTGDNITDGSGTLKVGDWTNNTTYTGSFTTAALTTNTVTGQITTGQFLNGSGTLGTEDENLNMILIPQTTPDATTTYSSGGDNAAYSGSYIALKMTIKQAGGSIVIADATASGKWAMWPVKFTWEPGKQYTYVIDLADGGYWETNTAGTTSDLDPVLEGAVIKFVDVTVDAWNTTPGETPVSM